MVGVVCCECGEVLAPSAVRGRPRAYCSDRCRTAAYRRRKQGAGPVAPPALVGPISPAALSDQLLALAGEPAALRAAAGRVAPGLRWRLERLAERVEAALEDEGFIRVQR